MTKRKALSSAGLIVVIAISLFVCPLATAGSLGGQDVAAQAQLAQISFEPQLTPLGIEATPEASTPAILQPGQYFEENDSNRPEVDADTLVGDALFGYAQLVGDPSLTAVWITDSEGTHYLIVDSASDVLTGGGDPNNGFFQLANHRDQIHSQILVALDNRDAHHETADTFRWGTLAAAIGWAACAILTGGLCLPVVAIGAGALWYTENKDNDAQVQQNLIEGYQRDLADDERLMRGRFKIGQSLYGQP